MQLDPGRVSLSPSVRRAGLADAAELAQLVNRAYQVESTFVDGNRTDEGDVARLAQNGEFLVLDRAGGGPVAAIHVHIDGARGTFGMLSVAPEVQGLGLGRRLVAVAEALCVAMGCTEMTIEVVNLREELPSWYRSLGYREVGTSPYSPPNRVPTRTCHFIHMEKALAA